MKKFIFDIPERRKTEENKNFSYRQTLFIIGWLCFVLPVAKILQNIFAFEMAAKLSNFVYTGEAAKACVGLGEGFGLLFIVFVQTCKGG